MTAREDFDGRVGLVQMALSGFRAPVVDALAPACANGLSVFAGKRREHERVERPLDLKHAEYVEAHNLHLLGGPAALCWQRGLEKWLWAWDPDVLIAEANPRWLSTRLAVRWMHRRRRPVLGWGLGTLSIGHRGLMPLRRLGRGPFIRSFDGMIAYSSQARREYEALGVPADRIWVAHNACTPRPAGPPPARPETRGGEATVLFVGRLLPGKRVENLIRACSTLRESAQPRLLIVGDGPERERLADLARTIYPTTKFLGPKFGAELEPVFRAADLFVLPGLGGLAVQEAMANGLPVIVAEGDGTQLDLVTGRNGWHVPPRDVETLCATLDEALSDMTRLRRMGAESYRVVAEEINIATMVEKIVRALNAIRDVRRG